MFGIIKLIILVVVIGVVAVVAVGALVIYSAINAEPVEVSPETIAQGQAVERKIEEAVANKSAFFLELTDDELSALVMSKAAETSASVRDIRTEITPGFIEISGHLNATPAVPFSGTVAIDFFADEFEIELQNVSLGLFPVPGAIKDELQPLIDQGLDINRALQQSGATQIQQFKMELGKVTIVGIQRAGQTVSDVTKNAFIQAFQGSGGRPVPEPPGDGVVPPGTTGGKPGSELYLALGDSLAANVGVNRPEDGYVSRFHSFLEKKEGRELGLTNLGVSGESSISIMADQLPQALQEIFSRKNDGDPDTKVSFLTLDLGANDLIAHLGSADCQNDPRGNACQTRINAGLETFDDNFNDIVDALADALEPDAEFYIMTMYNPFDFGIGLPFEDFSDEIMEKLNAIVRSKANDAGAKLADPFPIAKDTAAAWTNMLQGDIHPNEKGYQALAFSLAEASGF